MSAVESSTDAGPLEWHDMGHVIPVFGDLGPEHSDAEDEVLSEHEDGDHVWACLSLLCLIRDAFTWPTGGGSPVNLLY